jgi:hypothetical protein
VNNLIPGTYELNLRVAQSLQITRALGTSDSTMTLTFVDRTTYKEGTGILGASIIHRVIVPT